MASEHPVQIAKYTCGVTSTTFEGMWKTIFGQLTVERETGTMSLEGLLPENPGSEDIRQVFTQADSPSVIVIDEIDTIAQTDTIPMLADTIKTLSDHSVETTLVLVGVADSVDGLIAEHKSIERALLQVQMPRMSPDELLEIIDKGLDANQADMTIDSAVKGHIAYLSQGLPNYTHQLAKYAALNAIADDRTDIGETDLTAAIREVVDKQQQTIKSTYHAATSSARDNLFKEVLLACALAPIDELGYFNAGAVREPMKKVTGHSYDIPAFSQHLNDFCGESRGCILEKKGEQRRFRFRFSNPMMQPYVILKGIAALHASGTAGQTFLMHLDAETKDAGVSSPSVRRGRRSECAAWRASAAIWPWCSARERTSWRGWDVPALSDGYRFRRTTARSFGRSTPYGMLWIL
jgi:Cdc6-like AAA superfamily ATPase